MENCANSVFDAKTTIIPILYLPFMVTNHWLTQMLNLGQLSECQPNMTRWLLTLWISKWENLGVNKSSNPKSSTLASTQARRPIWNIEDKIIESSSKQGITLGSRLIKLISPWFFLGLTSHKNKATKSCKLLARVSMFSTKVETLALHQEP
jgi:hypothetical protein